jgi:hypothetical protein
MRYLDEIVPAPARKVVYAILGLATLVLGIVAATPDVDLPSWVDTVIAVLAALGFGGAATLTRDLPEVDYAGDEEYELGEHGDGTV